MARHERARSLRRRTPATTQENDPQPDTPHDLTQAETNPQHLKSRDNREDARHADHHAKGVQCSGKPSCQHSASRYQQHPLPPTIAILPTNSASTELIANQTVAA
jgi:hypothetical protein